MSFGLLSNVTLNVTCRKIEYKKWIYFLEFFFFLRKWRSKKIRTKEKENISRVCRWQWWASFQNYFATNINDRESIRQSAYTHFVYFSIVSKPKRWTFSSFYFVAVFRCYCCCHRVPFFLEFRSIMFQPLHLRSTLFLLLPKPKANKNEHEIMKNIKRNNNTKKKIYTNQEKNTLFGFASFMDVLLTRKQTIHRRNIP